MMYFSWYLRLASMENACYTNSVQWVMHNSTTYHQLRTRRALSIFKDVPLRARRVLSIFKDVPLRARRALSIFKDVPLRTRRALSIFKDVPLRARRVLSIFKDIPLRTRRALSIFKDVPLRTRRALSIFKDVPLRARRVLSIFKDVPLRTTERRYHCTMSVVIVPICFSMEHLWIVIAPFRLSTDNIYFPHGSSYVTVWIQSTNLFPSHQIYTFFSILYSISSTKLQINHIAKETAMLEI